MTHSNSQEPERIPPDPSVPPGSEPSADPQEGGGAPPTPAAAMPTRVWNAAKKDGMREKLEEAGIEWKENIDEAWIEQTSKDLRQQGNPALAQEMRAAIIKKIPPMSTAAGRQQQIGTLNSVNKERKKAQRNTVTDDRGRKVARKYNVYTLMSIGAAALIAIGLLGWGGVNAYKSSVAKTQARTAAQLAADPKPVIPDSAVPQVDANGAVNPNPTAQTTTTAATGGTGTQGGSSGTGSTTTTSDPPSGTTSTTSAPPPADTNGAYNKGYQEGKLAGYSGGQRDGYNTGQADGYRKGASSSAGAAQSGGYSAPPPASAVALPVSTPQASAGTGTQSAPIGTGTQGAPTGRVAAAPTGAGASLPQGKLDFVQGAQGSQGAVPAGRLSFGAGSTTGGANGSSGSGRNGGSTDGGNTGSSGGGAGGQNAQAGAGQSGTTGQSGNKLAFVTNPSQGGQPPSSQNAFQFKEAAPSQSTATNAAGGRLVMTGMQTGQNGQNAQDTQGGASSQDKASAASGSDTTDTGCARLGATSGDKVFTISDQCLNGPAAQAAVNAAAQGVGSALSGSASGGRSQSSGSASATTFGPYRPYQTINAQMQTSTLILEGEKTSLPIIAVSSDGRKWVGHGTLNQAQRVNLIFDTVVDLDGQTVLKIPAAAYDAAGNPGMQASGEDLAPDLIRNLLRSAATGVQDYASAALNASTTVTAPNGTVTVSKTAPGLWTLVGSRALSVFNLPNNTPTFTRATYLPAGTNIVLMVGAAPATTGSN